MKTLHLAFVTGASSGLGLALATRLIDLGYEVYGTYNKTLPSQTSKIHYLRVDLTSDSSCHSVLGRFFSGKNIDVVINCAGISPSGVTTDFTSDQFTQVIQTNCGGPFRVIKELLPSLTKTHGLIINVTSLNGFFALPHSGIYSASKFALEALSFSLRQELAPLGIKVVTAAPGAFVKQSIKPALPIAHLPVRDKFPLLRYLFPFTTQEQVVDSVISLLDNPHPPPRIIIGRDAQVCYLALKLIPFTWVDWLISNVWQKRGSLAFRS